MGDFRGHSMLGTAFLIFGLWWSIKYPLKYLRGGVDSKRYQRLEMVEGIVKAVIAATGMILENFAPSIGPHFHLINPVDHSWVGLMGWLHSSLYIFYVLSGVVDILTYSPLKLPPGLDRLTLGLAVSLEGLLMSYHVHSQPPVEGLLHKLLLVVFFAGFLCFMAEVFLRDHIVLELIRTSLAILQGTWFWQIAITVYPPRGVQWDQNDHSNLAFLPICFVWHYAVAFLIIIINYCLVHWYTMKHKRSSDVERIKFQKLGSAPEDSRVHLLGEMDEE